MPRTPYLFKILFDSLVWKFPKSAKEKCVYLTFDDGPVPEVTPWVLDQLKEHNAQATFFCVGENVQKNPEIYNQVIESGHTVGNHTQNHLNGWYTPNSIYYRNILACSEVVKSDYFRPPYGKIKPMQLKKIQKHYKVVLWDILSEDYNPAVSPQECLLNVVEKVKNGDIIVFHDSQKAHKNLSYALPKTLNFLSEKGYKFLAL